SRADIRTFLLDTNVFVSAIKEPTKQTTTLRLIIKLVNDPALKLVGNYLLAHEMLRYAELLKSETAAALLAVLLSKMEIVGVGKNYRKVCKAYIKTPDRADIMHAATCLQTGAVLITNDKHFGRISDEGIIEVWSLSKSIRNLL
ncbi:MAG: PIN domain-containing protein, partial [Nitrososphaerales archaeon]